MRALKFSFLFASTVSLWAQEQILPLVVAGGAGDTIYRTVLYLTSSSSSPVTGTATFLSPDGTPWNVHVEDRATPVSTLAWTVPAGGMGRYVLLGGDQTQLGWVLISPERRGMVSASATVLRPGADGIVAAAGVSLARRLQSAAFVHDSLGLEADTAIVIANPNTIPIDCQISVTESGGQSRASLMRTVPPKGHLASSVIQLFSAVPAIDETAGLVKVACNRPFAALALHFSGRTFSDLPAVAGPIERYGFEDTVTGWRPGTFEQARAIQSCSPSEREPYAGRFSLQCRVDLSCRSTDRANGEVEVDLRGHPPGPDVIAPLDFDGVRITARVRAPQQAAGLPSNPNGWQLYVKDTSFRGFVGSWRNIEPDTWTQIDVTPGRAAPSGGFIAPGFDAANVSIVGVKLGCGTGSTTVFSGDVFIDVVSW